MSIRYALVALLAICVTPFLARAQDFEAFQPGDWELTLGGGGSNGSDFDGTTFSVNGSLGYFFTENVEVALRQTIGYTDITGASGSTWSGSTRVAADFHFDLGRWQPFVGANIGYIYGEVTNDTFIAGPEAGVKFFVNDTTFVFVMAEYQFFFDSGDDADDIGETIDDGQFVYTLGLGFKW